MSGIVGIVNTNGAPVSTELLDRMVASLRFRGPDCQNVWCSFEAGLGHALLETSRGTAADKQPCSIDGNVWIVADARIDGRAALTEELRSRGTRVAANATDAELILIAYSAWGKDCLNHLIGDFAFAIWDAASKQLLCARDHFGVKPFYYADLPGSFVFSNTLNCLRLHPEVSSRLNDLAICDYLLFGSNQDPGTTSFEQIQRLAPGHSLLWSESKVFTSRYWSLPQTSELHYKKRQDYIENFRSLLRMAVQDRLPDGPVAVSMSGGLDSSTVAATAQQVLGEGHRSRLQAYAVVYDRLIPDQERWFAGKVAEFCGIPLHYLVADDYQLFQHWRDKVQEPAEPCDQPLAVINHDLYQKIAVQSRVVLTGEGGDPCLLPSSRAIVELLRTAQLWDLATGYMRCALWQRSLPKAGLRTLIRARKKTEDQPFLPKWINRELARKLDLPNRYAELEHEILPVKIYHRPETYKSLTHSWWANGFELCDPGNAPKPVETRHPFFDVRLINFLFSLPTLPWCIGKQIIREAMVGFLPGEVVRRKKTPLAGDPLIALLRQPQSEWVDSLHPMPELLSYVNPSRIPQLAGTNYYSTNPWLDLRPLSLDHWLRMRDTVGYKGRA